jgi:hypothetical protein
MSGACLVGGAADGDDPPPQAARVTAAEASSDVTKYRGSVLRPAAEDRYGEVRSMVEVGETVFAAIGECSWCSVVRHDARPVTGEAARALVSSQCRADLIGNGHRHEEPIGRNGLARCRCEQEVSEQPATAPHR